MAKKETGAADKAAAVTAGVSDDATAAGKADTPPPAEAAVRAAVLRDNGPHRVGEIVTLSAAAAAEGVRDGWLDINPDALRALGDE